ncbi:hypothetical protein [Streptomyces sp. Ncost-T10-10d]|uniref:hypothetical protein n=1 Tax=Streptomyces sp. Ncost-T10-10d TaxID=1839774 RepID=UPI00081F4845|nr:hypothetical protein GA0115254_128716 [Streptomyces sp. Ncost-T10-10d]
MERIAPATGRPRLHHQKRRTPRRHQRALLSDLGIPLERIAMPVGHSSQETTEAVSRKQLRPVIMQGAEVMDEIFGFEDSRGDSEA